jgi:hypothetical protein
MSLGPGQQPDSDRTEALAARYLAPWDVDELIPPPRRQRRNVLAMLGPGVLMAGTAIGAGEWLFGPAVSAQYGGTLLWLATISIVVQVFYNLEVMRYALYSGEPILVGFFRTWPGPKAWTACYMVLFIAHIWPFMASNAAVPLAAAMLGHLPGDGVVRFAGLALSESGFVKLLGFVVFYLAFVPLVFGGKIYTMLERLMTFKLVIILGFLTIVTFSMVSAANMWEVVSGFVRFGSVPLRAETVVAGNHFTIAQTADPAANESTSYVLQGTIDDGTPVVTGFKVKQGGKNHAYSGAEDLPPELADIKARLLARAVKLARPGQFFVESIHDRQAVSVAGEIGGDGQWRAVTASVSSGGTTDVYRDLAQVPEPYREQVESLVANQGFQREQMFSYWRRHGRLPDLDWAMLAAFAAIAGAGGLSNALLSNYARDKGWGMGDKTGAIPSAIGGRTISLSHVGKVFRVNEESLGRWRGWMRHIIRDQAGMWMICSFIGMALPCMLSLQFIRNAPVSGNRVAAMTAEGIAAQFPSSGQFWWSITLLVSFLALAPNAIFSGDLIARLWTDVLWVGSRRTQRLEGHQVRYVYYGILAIFGLWGSVTLAWLDPLQIAKLGAVLQNIALGFSAFHTLYVNRTLLPREIRPNWFMQAGLIATGVYFLSITALAAWYL